MRARVDSYKNVVEEKQKYVQVSIAKRRPSREVLQANLVQERIEALLASKRFTVRRNTQRTPRASPRPSPRGFVAPSWRAGRRRQSAVVTHNVFEPWKAVATAAPPRSFQFALPSARDGVPKWLLELKRRKSPERKPQQEDDIESTRPAPARHRWTKREKHRWTRKYLETVMDEEEEEEDEGLPTGAPEESSDDDESSLPSPLAPGAPPPQLSDAWEPIRIDTTSPPPMWPTPRPGDYTDSDDDGSSLPSLPAMPAPQPPGMDFTPRSSVESSVPATPRLPAPTMARKSVMKAKPPNIGSGAVPHPRP